MPPIRSCIACRRKASPAELLRFVADAHGVVQLDDGVQRAGRGAWVHPHRDCVAKVLKRPQAIRRALRCSARAEGLDARLHAATLQQLRVALGRASRSGCVVSGHQAILSQLAVGELLAIAAASDASERSLDALCRSAPGVSFHVLDLDRRRLGEQVGKGPRAAVAVRRGSPA